MRRIDATLRRLQRWDEDACLRLNRALRYGFFLWLLRAVSRLGDGVIWYALMAALLARYGGRALQPVLHMMFVGAVGAATYAMVKRSTSRPRPYQALKNVALGAPALDAFSFPSGHTLHATAFALVACAYYPALAPLLVPFAVLTGVSRVMLGLHYPSDVLAGAALGALIAAASFGI
jgi:undecaprenyl-diphosphatase